MRLQNEAGGQVQAAIRLETGALLFNCHVGMHGAFKIFLAELLQALIYMDPECLTDIEVLAGDLDLHGFRKSFSATSSYKTWAREMLTSTNLKMFLVEIKASLVTHQDTGSGPQNGAETSRVGASSQLLTGFRLGHPAALD
jgi:hypothetical protein